MTTICAKGREMAADSQLTGDYMLRVTKIYRLPDGSLVAGAGAWARCYSYIQWLLAPQGEAPTIDECSLLMVRPDGSHWVIEDGGTYPLLDTVTAIGAGSQAAMAAMLAGASPAAAVAQACHLDASSSEPIQSMKIQPVKRRK